LWFKSTRPDHKTLSKSVTHLGNKAAVDDDDHHVGDDDQGHDGRHGDVAALVMLVEVGR